MSYPFRHDGVPRPARRRGVSGDGEPQKVSICHAGAAPAIPTVDIWSISISVRRTIRGIPGSRFPRR